MVSRERDEANVQGAGAQDTGAQGAGAGEHGPGGRGPAPAPVRVVLADDAVLVREGVALVLGAAGLQVQAQVGDGRALLQAVARWRPHVAVVDVRMPPTGPVEGLRAAAAIQREHPATGVLLLSNHCETHHLDALLRGAPAGVGYLLKERVVDTETFVASVRSVARGGRAVDPEVFEALLTRARARRGVVELTVREREVLTAMAVGASNHALSRRFGVSLKTVESHTASIFRKLGLLEDVDEHRRVKAVLTHLQQERT
ncbi:LuxR C-terminal-related transcriptional regulator [Kineococcus sp. SYSU DK005]|uniref:LuxR C-terminal-related transcriptional regulator n=1 Tax=Kineococcus sp. SYSU DK005 TaxID=3383126 RepID=UPI003D7D2466